MQSSGPLCVREGSEGVAEDVGVQSITQWRMCSGYSEGVQLPSGRPLLCSDHAKLLKMLLSGSLGEREWSEGVAEDVGL